MLLTLLFRGIPTWPLRGISFDGPSSLKRLLAFNFPLRTDILEDRESDNRKENDRHVPGRIAPEDRCRRKEQQYEDAHENRPEFLFHPRITGRFGLLRSHDRRCCQFRGFRGRANDVNENRVERWL